MVDFGQTVRGPEIPGRASLSLPTHVGILRLVDTNIYFFRPTRTSGHRRLPYPAKNAAHHSNRGQARCSPLVTDIASPDPSASPCEFISFAPGITSARSGNVRTSASFNSVR
jgi:hypothetical protein